MEEIGREFYAIEELAAAKEVTVDYILRLFFEKKLKMSIFRPTFIDAGQPSAEFFETLYDRSWALCLLKNKNAPMEYYTGIGDPEIYILKDIFVLAEEIVQAEAKRPDLFKPTAKHVENKNENMVGTNLTAKTQHPTGGAPKSPITEAVTWVYNRLVDSGNIELVKPGNLSGFLKYLKECVVEGNSNYSEYVAERIKEVKNIERDCKIIMQDNTPKEKTKFLTTGKKTIKTKTHISNILSGLRKK